VCLPSLKMAHKVAPHIFIVSWVDVAQFQIGDNYRSVSDRTVWKQLDFMMHSENVWIWLKCHATELMLLPQGRK
jgi:hypothetical protein